MRYSFWNQDLTKLLFFNLLENRGKITLLCKGLKLMRFIDESLLICCAEALVAPSVRQFLSSWLWSLPKAHPPKPLRRRVPKMGCSLSRKFRIFDAQHWRENGFCIIWRLTTRNFSIFMKWIKLSYALMQGFSEKAQASCNWKMQVFFRNIGFTRRRYSFGWKLGFKQTVSATEGEWCKCS